MFSIPYSYNKTVVNLFEENVAAFPERIAIFLENKSISYREFDEHVNQCANYLKKQGVQKGDIIGVELSRSYNMLLAIFAVLKVGAIYLPIDPYYPFERKKVIVAESKMAFLITALDDTSRDFAAYCGIIILNHDKILLEKNTFFSITGAPQDLCYILYTSGSTGQPKGVMIAHHALINRLEWMKMQFPLTKEDVIFQKTNPSFDVSVWEIFLWAIAGCSVVLLPERKEFDVILMAKMIEKFKISVIHFVPSVFKVFLNYIRTDFNLNRLKTLKYVFSSGEVLQPECVWLFNQFFSSAHFPILVNLYGPTEATIDVSFFICNKQNGVTDTDQTPIPIGKPIQNIELLVLDENLYELPPGVAGELYIAGVGLAQGYLNNPELTAQAFIAHPRRSYERLYKTGDLVKWREDGELLFLGRNDEQIKLRGLRIELKDIEYHFCQHEAVSDAVISCIDSGADNQILVAFVVKKQPELSQEDLKKFLALFLPHYMVPNHITFLDVFPLKPNGKRDLGKIKENFLSWK